MGQPTASAVPHCEYIALRGKPSELKHLSSWRKGHQPETPLVVASERGPGQWLGENNQNGLERPAIAGDSPVWVEFFLSP